ncbi:MAG: hypothetical protein HON14_01375, partial [Rhodospirillaceae bacterium]|nr:hypothetical protein [Rhodospirillaceae bacterium]
MAPSDIPGDDEKNFGRRDNDPEEVSDHDVPNLRLPAEGAPLPGPDEYLADVEIPLDDIPELDTGDLRADTLEFERIARRSKPKRTGLKFLLLVVLLGGAGYGAWAQWGDEIIGRNADELPIVRASEKPLKVRPEKPGGIEIPNRDKLVYDRLEKKPPEEKTENLLPRPEVPLSPPQPKPVEKAEITVKPEPKQETKPAPAKTVGSQPTTAEVAAVKKPAPAPKPPQSEKKIVAAQPKEVAPIAALQFKAAVNTSYQIQLAAVRNEAAAKKEWARLQKKHQSLLGKLSLNVVRADLGKRGIYYRLRAGTFANQVVAKALCQSLAKVKVACLV